MALKFTKLAIGDPVATSGSKCFKKLSTEVIDEPTDCLKLVASSPKISFFMNGGGHIQGTIEYSVDKASWTNYSGSTTLIIDSSVLYVRGYGNTTFFYETSTTFSGGMFSCTCLNDDGERIDGTIDIYGNYTALLNYKAPDAAMMGNYCFFEFFNGQIRRVPDIKCDSIPDYAFRYAFKNASKLQRSPSIECKTSGKGAFRDMCLNRVSLTSAGRIVATQLGETSCAQMFKGCTSLLLAPEVTAESLGTDCCYKMFAECTSLVTPPELSATTLGDYCYYGMFTDCTALKQIPELPLATSIGIGSYWSMFLNCSSLTKPAKLPYLSLPDSVYARMFEGCTSIKLSETQSDEYKTPYRIPTSGTGSVGTDSLTKMFTNTGGTFTGTPEINTIYYGAWSDD